MSGTVASPEGITNPPIDELLEATDSKYSLVIYASKRARQINAYYSQLGEGLLEYVGPLVETHVAGEAAVDRAARDQRRPADRRGRTTPRPRPPPAPRLTRRATRPPTEPGRPTTADPGAARVVLGVGGGIAAYKAVRAAAPAHRVRPRRHGRPDPRPRCTSSARPPGRRCPASRSPPRSGTTSHEVPHVRLGQQADLVVVAPATADLLARAAAGLADDLLDQRPAHRALPGRVWPPRCTPRCGSTPPPRPTSRPCARAACIVIDPAVGRLTGADSGPGRLPEPDEIFAACRAVLARRGSRRPRRPHASWSRPAAPASTSTRCASSATAAAASRATRSRATAAARGARVVLVRPTSRCPTPPGATVVRVDVRRGAARAPCSSTPPTPTSS